MDKVIEKFANTNWFYRVILLAIVGLSLHIRYLSEMMGR